MAEPLKTHFGPEIPARIAKRIAEVDPTFPRRAFLRDALSGYEALELIPRGWHIARALRRHLPEDYERAIEILLASQGPVLPNLEGAGMAPFLYLPHVLFVAEYGLDHFETSMRAQYELTQRFSAEFSIRRYIEWHRERTLARLRVWASDPSVHVRRLVSEGTRPRLPWAPRLREFQKDPTPVLALLELLKDDPELYVRRSVANNLNDIGKDHPELLVETARRWMVDAGKERQWLVRHALRSLVKAGAPGALSILGFGATVRSTIQNVSITPRRPNFGDKVTITFDVVNATRRVESIAVDLRVHFVKANGNARPKVFKGKEVRLEAGASALIQKTISLADLTTRTHYPGIHRIDVVLNGGITELGSFELRR